MNLQLQPNSMFRQFCDTMFEIKTYASKTYARKVRNVRARTRARPRATWRATSAQHAQRLAQHPVSQYSCSIFVIRTPFFFFSVMKINPQKNPTRATRATRAHRRATCAQRRATPAEHLPRNVRAACATSRATRATSAQCLRIVRARRPPECRF